MISVIIPAYKKTEELIANLTNNMPLLKGCEVLVVNDDPSESIKDKISSDLKLRVIENTQNMGFAGAVNVGLKAATGEYALLLNSDVKLLDDSFKNASKHFEKDKQLFAVSFAQIEDNGTIVGRNTIYWQRGLFNHSSNRNITTGPTAWAEGGSSLFRLDIVKKLHYFDTAYSPFYWEDIDLSYRALKQGYSILFDADIKVEHHHESTIGSFFKQSKIKRIAYRNQLLFIWKNISDLDLRVKHFLYLPLHLIKMTLKGEFMFIMGFIDALIKMKNVRKEKTHDALSDYEVLKRFAK